MAGQGLIKLLFIKEHTIVPSENIYKTYVKNCKIFRYPVDYVIQEYFYIVLGTRRGSGSL